MNPHSSMTNVAAHAGNRNIRSNRATELRIDSLTSLFSLTCREQTACVTWRHSLSPLASSRSLVHARRREAAASPSRQQPASVVISRCNALQRFTLPPLHAAICLFKKNLLRQPYKKILSRDLTTKKATLRNR